MRDSVFLRPRILSALLLLVALPALGAVVRGGAQAAPATPPPARHPGKPLGPAPIPAVPPRAAQDPARGAPPVLQVPERVGGPDAYGYMVSDSTEPHGPIFNYISAPNLILAGDDMTTTVNLPFPISIYDRTAYTLTLNTNGLAYIPQGGCLEPSNPCYQNYNLPNVDAPPATVAPFWDDLVLTTTVGGGVYAGTFGTSPARTFVVEWRNGYFYNDPTSMMNAEIVFHENSNEIDFQYGTLSGADGNGSTSVIGIQNYAQTIGLMYSSFQPALSSNMAVRFLALVSPGDQGTITAPCSSVIYSGRVTNPFTQTTTFQLSVADSNPIFGSVVTPTNTGGLLPGSSVSFSVGMIVPPDAPVSATNVTTLTVASQNPVWPLTEAVHLDTEVDQPGADFVPGSINGAGQTGTTVTYTLHLYNRVGPAAAFHLEAQNNNWPTQISPVDTQVLAPGVGVTVTVQVQIPDGTPLGEADVTSLVATAQLSGSCAFSGTGTITTFNNNQVGRQPLPQPRARQALVDFPLDGRVYMLGGVTLDNNRNLPIDEYDPRADTWTARTTLVHPVSNVSGAVIGSTIYVPGGFDGAASDQLQTYSPLDDTAAVVGSDPLPAPRYGAGVVAVGNRLLVIGGADNVTATRTVLIYDPGRPAGSRWSTGAPMPTARAFAATAVVDGLVYVAGGIADPNNPVDLGTLEIYDPATDQWTAGPPLLTPRGGAAAIGVDTGQPCGGYLYVFGGGWDHPLASVERYDPAAQTWAAIAPLTVARRTLAAAYASNGHLLLVVGGYQDGEVSTVDAVGCGGVLATATPTPVGGVPTFTPTPSCASSYSDVTPADYFYPAVRYLTCHGVLAGYADGTFRPYANMTRGQLSKVVVLAEDWTIQTPTTSHFSDVPPSNPFYIYIENAYAHNIIDGYSDGTFRWGNDVTRGQIAKIVALAEGWLLLRPDQPDFSDVPPDHPFYTFVETAFYHGILSGYADGTFRPYAPATRGQVSKIVYLMLGSP